MMRIDTRPDSLRWISLAAALTLAPPCPAWSQVDGAGPGVRETKAFRRDATVLAVEEVMPSVVTIITRTRVQRRGFFYDWWRENWAPYYQELPPVSGAGSGVIIDPEGFVLTNVHVVESADEIWVKLSDGRTLRALPIVGTRRTDIALLKLQRESDETFKAVRFAAEDDVLLGETVIALGNPFGLGGSVSRGILSSKIRRQPGDSSERLEVPDWLQTDAAINPGNSGGPLVNLSGEVIGINVAVDKRGQGIGFAIPIRQVAESLSDMYTPELIHRIWFGARLGAGRDFGRVLSVFPASPAQAAGLRSGDRIVAVNGTEAGSFIRLTDLLGMRTGEECRLMVQRDGRREELDVRSRPIGDLFRERMGLEFQELTRELAGALAVGSIDGLLIADVVDSGAAAEANLQPGLVVSAIDGQSTADLGLAAALIAPRPAGDELKLSVITREERGRFVTLRELQMSLRLR
jgi:S1-C subfamily serine protease